MKSLDISFNSIKILEEAIFQGLNQLEFLFANNNHISKLPQYVFYDVTNLHELNLDSNNLFDDQFGIDNDIYLKDRPFNRLTNLTYLSLSNNSHVKNATTANLRFIEPHAFAELVNLRTLLFAKNQLAFVADNTLFQDMINLETLNLSTNLLLSLPDNPFSSLTQLKSLDLSFNLIGLLNSAVLRGLVNLEFLSLSGNSLSGLSVNFFTDATNLRHLFLAENGLSLFNGALFEPLRRLETLDLGANNFCCISANLFAPLSNLKRLYLDRNRLNTIYLQGQLRNLSQLTHLKVLHFSFKCV